MALCDGKFPNSDGVKYDGDNEPVSEICFQPEYVAKALRWAGFNPGPAVFSFNGETNAMGVRFKDENLADVHMTLMPCRF